MDSKQEIKEIEQSIKESFKRISVNYYNFFMNDLWDNTNVDYSEKNNIEAQVSIEIVILFNMITLYFEKAGLKDYLERFRRKFSKRIDNDDNLHSFAPCIPVGIDGFDEDFVILEEFRQFLYPFPFFGQRENNKTTFYLKLKDVLEETSTIMSICNKQIKNETDISKEVLKILTLYFTSVKKTKGTNFIQHYKRYKPDIIVPELKTTIEYKYIKQESPKTIDDYIDEVYIDSTNYTGDENYNKFIAVLCLQKGLTFTKKKIFKSWEQKKFPSNWELIVVNNL